MAQVNYINLNRSVDTTVDFLKFTGFLFYINSWSWLNLPKNTNFDTTPQARANLQGSNLDFVNKPEDVIESISLKKEDLNSTLSIFETSIQERFYYIAATARRYTMQTPIRSNSNSTEFIPISSSVGNWNLWGGDIQAYSPDMLGSINLGSKLFAKNMSIQNRTPVSILNSTNKNKFIGEGGFGEINSNSYISNYNNEGDILQEEALCLNDGWYGLITKKSTPHLLAGGTGIDFDTFFRLQDNTVTEFSSLYPEDYINNLSAYGQNYNEYIT